MRNQGNLHRLLLLSPLLLFGCAISTQELRTTPHEKGTITVDLPWSTVFANITKSVRECFPDRVLNRFSFFYTTSLEIEPGKFGEVKAINGHAGNVKDVFVMVDVDATPTGTAVQYYISRRFFGTYDDSSSFRPIAEAWATGNGKRCS